MSEFDPAFWVALSFVVFVAVAWRPVARTVTKGLDERSAKIKAELDEATRLREEAQEILASYQTRQRESLKEAEALIAKAREDAARITADAEAALKAAIEQRTRAARDKIAQAESKALQEVRAHVVDFAISAARSIIMNHMDKTAADDMLRMAVQDVERKLH